MPSEPTSARTSVRALLPAACVVALAAVHILLSAAWMRENGFFSPRPPFQDAAYWRLDSWKMMRAWQEGGVAGWLQAGLDHDRAHPPVLTMLAAWTSLPEGDVSVESQWRVEMIFLGLLAIVAYRLARNFGGPWFSVLAAAAMMSAPVIIANARIFFPKFPLMVLVLAALDALLRSRAFTRFWWSIAFGAISGFATLTFMLAPLYLVGSAAFALVIGLVRARARGAVVLNAAVSIVMMTLVASTWYWRHWEETLRYATAVTESAGQSRFSHGLPLWSLERWIFYPRALVNTGIGFLLALWVVGLLLVRIRDRISGPGRGEPRDGPSFHAPGATLAVGAVVSFVAVVRGQTAGQSEYVMNLAPLLLLYASWAISRIRAPRRRAVVAACFGATCVLMIALSCRSVHRDVPALSFGGLNVIDTYDRYGADVVRAMDLEITPKGEVWPFDEFLDVMVARSPNTRLRLGENPHVLPYMNSGNIFYAAAKRGIPLQTEVLGLGAGQAEIDSFANHADFMIFDLASPPPGRCFELVEAVRTLHEAAGGKFELVARRKMASRCELVLVQIVRPHDRPKIVPASVEDEPWFRKLDVTFDNGWRLAGMELISQRGSAALVRTFWHLDPPGDPGFEVVGQMSRDQRFIGSASAPMPAAPRDEGGERRFATATMQFDLGPPDPAWSLAIALVRGGSGSRQPEVMARPVETHGRPLSGPHFVVVAP